MLDIRVSILTSVSHRPGFVRHYYNDVTRRGIVTEMEEHEWLAQRFDAHRTHLRAVAYTMLGSISEADDAVQQTWLRLSRSDTSGIENLGGWLTTVVGWVCLDMLRSRRSTREGLLGVHVPEPIVSRADGIDPEHEALLIDSVSLALLVVLETLPPPERLAPSRRSTETTARRWCPTRGPVSRLGWPQRGAVRKRRLGGRVRRRYRPAPAPMEGAGALNASLAPALDLKLPLSLRASRSEVAPRTHPWAIGSPTRWTRGFGLTGCSTIVVNEAQLFDWASRFSCKLKGGRRGSNPRP